MDRVAGISPEGLQGAVRRRGEVRPTGRMSRRFSDVVAYRPPFCVLGAEITAPILTSQQRLPCQEAHIPRSPGRDGGQLIVVDDASQAVVNLTGGDQEFWSRSIAD